MEDIFSDFGFIFLGDGIEIGTVGFLDFSSIGFDIDYWGINFY